MADLCIRGYVGVTDATNEPRSLRVGSDLVVRLRLASEPVPETAQPDDLLTRADFEAMSYRVFRRVTDDNEHDVDTLVEDYESVAITVADVIPADTVRTWGKDGVGYNFRHVVPRACFAGNCLHIIEYFFTVDGVLTVHPVFVEVEGPIGDAFGTAGTGQVTGQPGTPGADGARMIFSQTATTFPSVSNTAAETSLVGSGEGTSEIAADSWAVGETLLIEASGDYSTKASLPGNASVLIKIASDLTLSFPINLLAAQPQKEWRLRARFTRLTATLVVGAGELLVDNAGLSIVGTPNAVTVAADVTKTVDVKIDWETADAGNIWRMRQYSLEKTRGAA